jgi:hypothetical protein
MCFTVIGVTSFNDLDLRFLTLKVPLIGVFCEVLAAGVSAARTCLR